eukprot:maker-scaffold319_size207808-snap-gene-0.25 protein:Tk00366 transcript:maker-scaffold319_size207808-snap-gene-0.25-mRNA-1 annotation:"GI15521"
MVTQGGQPMYFNSSLNLNTLNDSTDTNTSRLLRNMPPTNDTDTPPPSLVSKFLHEFAAGTFYLWDLLSPYITTPIAILFLLPVVMFSLIYLSAFILYLHQRGPGKIIRRIRRAVVEEHDLAKAGREIVATIWDFQGWIWFGYEVKGLENIPTEGPALIIYYHGALPIDYYYLVAKIILQKQRGVHSVVDRFLFKIPGMGTFLKVFNCTPGSVEICVAELNKGNLLGLAPGGVYEALFGDHHYELMWKKRTGFARIALEAGCPVIPVFTQNVRESFRAFQYFTRIFTYLYEKTRLPLVPVYGGFPVKLITHVGVPITLDPGTSPEEARITLKTAVEDLIDESQECPGSIFRAFCERFKRESSHDLLAKASVSKAGSLDIVIMATPRKLRINDLSPKRKATNPDRCSLSLIHMGESSFRQLGRELFTRQLSPDLAKEPLVAIHLIRMDRLRALDGVNGLHHRRIDDFVQVEVVLGTPSRMGLRSRTTLVFVAPRDLQVIIGGGLDIGLGRMSLVSGHDLRQIGQERGGG